ncbi:SDR family NAD(P)-dependent oxidoreductase [Pelagibius sp.]|uniref:SDR family NAD(P)-dependent oxidoreductase n=1 Tax=Pelagibius sp. TaxID=1931238 RepID=UPI003BAEA4DC
MTVTAKDLSEISALVVGGTSGIGFAAAEALLRAGVPRLRVVGRNPERAALAVDDLRRIDEGADVGALVLDCGDGVEAEKMAEAAAKGMEGIDLLVCSPGGNNLPELLFRQPIAQLNDTLLQDLAPTLNACRAVLPVMMQAGSGCMLTVASDAGKVATPGETVIGAVMAAIIQFTRGLAIEGKRNGVRANAITPSLVEGTALTERLMADGTFSKKLFEKARPLAGLGPTTAQDLAELIVFLASPAAAKITGQAISVNGGISAA